MSDEKKNGDCGYNPGEKIEGREGDWDETSEETLEDIDFEEIASNLQDKKQYANVYMKAGEVEVNIEANKEMDEVVEQAAVALQVAEKVYSSGNMPTQGVH